MIRVLTLVSVVWLTLSQAAWAQGCPRAYEIVPGDSLSRIAEAEYQNGFLWSQIFAANRDVIGDDPDTILHGTVIELPCAAGEGAGVDAVVSSSLRPPRPAEAENTAASGTATVKLVVVPDMAPFSGGALPGGGLLIDLVRSALSASAPESPLRVVNKVPSPSATSVPVSDTITLHVPALRMSCADPAEMTLCNSRVYSAPLFEAWMVVYVHKDRPIPMADPREMHGYRLCRPSGWPLVMLDAQGRDWLSGGHVSLTQPPSALACMRALQRGDVDGVVLNEFTGQAALRGLDAETDIVALHRSPLGIVSLHAAADVQSAESVAAINEVNAGLEMLRDTGAARAILQRHLNTHWAGS